MSLEFKFVAQTRYDIDGVRYEYVEAYDAERNNPGSGEENLYFFRQEKTRCQERFTESEIRRIREKICERGAKVRGPSVDRPVPLKPSERRIQTFLQAYDASPFPLKKTFLELFLQDVRNAHPEFEPPTIRTFKTWVRERGETGRRHPSDYRDLRGRHRKRFHHEKVEWALRYAVLQFHAARYRARGDVYVRIVKFVVTLRRRTLKFEGKEAARQVKVPGRSTVYAAIAQGRTADLVEIKTSNREAVTQRGVRASLPDIAAHLDVVAIDSTVADTWIVFIPEMMLFLKRPVISLAIDAWSECVLATVVTWRDDIEAVFFTIKMSIMGKEDLIVGRPHLEWLDVSGASECYLVDNALCQTGKSFQDALADVGSSVHWAPKENPPYKYIVERAISSLKSQCLQKLPAGIPYSATVLRRLGYDPKTDGTPILSDVLQERVLDWASNFNLSKNERHQLSRKLVWDDSVALHGCDYFPDLDLLDASFGIVVTVTVRRTGVKLTGLTFHDPDIVTRLLDSMGGVDAPDDFQVTRRGRRGPGKSPTATTKAKVTWSDLRYISVYDYVRQKYERLPCTLRLPSNVPLNSDFIKEWRRFAKQHQMGFRTDEEILLARDQYNRRTENTDMARKIEASRRTMQLSAERNLMPVRTTVVKGVAEPGPMAMRPAGAVDLEPLTPNRENDFMPVVGARRGGRKKHSVASARSPRSAGHASENEHSAETIKSSGKAPRRARPGKDADADAPPQGREDGSTELDPHTRLLLKML